MQTILKILPEIKEGLPWWSSGYDSASNAQGTGLISGWGTKILHAMWLGQKKKKEISGFSGGSVVKNLPDNAKKEVKVKDPESCHSGVSPVGDPL